MPDTARDNTPPGHLELLSSALESGRLAPVRRLINSLSAGEIGDLLESLPPARRQLVWGLVDSEYDGEVLVHVNDEVRASLIRDMDAEELVAASGSLDIDDLADIIEDLPETVVQEVLRSMDRENRERLEQVLAYPEDSAGGLMNPDMVTVRADVTLDVVLRYLRLRGTLPQATDTLYVVNRRGRYMGWLPLATLLTRDPSLTVREVADYSIEAIDAETPASDVARIFENHDLVSAPVVGEDGLLLGRITIDDVVDVIREEAEHSVLSMAGLDEEEDMFAPVFKSMRRRVIWLSLNLVAAFVAARVIGLFEATLEEVVALAILMPIVASMGGVAATQTMTLMVRGIAMGQVGTGNIRALLSKEMAVSLLNGLVLSLLVAAVAYLWFRNPVLSGVIGGALAANLLLASLAGVLLPLGLHRLKIDPALAGSMAVMTVTDVMGFFIFLGLGTILLL